MRVNGSRSVPGEVVPLGEERERGCHPVEEEPSLGFVNEALHNRALMAHLKAKAQLGTPVTVPLTFASASGFVMTESRPCASRCAMHGLQLPSVPARAP